MLGRGSFVSGGVFFLEKKGGEYSFRGKEGASEVSVTLLEVKS
jgi:hypothetical protein